MRSAGAPFRWPLQVQIGIVFVALILLIGTTLALVSYRQISELILQSTEEIFDEIADGIRARFQQEYRPVTKTVELLALSRLVQSRDLDERLEALPLLVEALANQPHVTSVQLGYADGAYLVMRSAQSSHVREAFHIPAQYSYIVDHLAPDATGRVVGERRFLYADLRTGATAPLDTSEYDPRTRPWFQNTAQAATTQITEPYYFYFTHQLGITVSRRDPATGTVVAADITLQGLSETLQRSNISPSATSVLFNDNGEVYAYSAADRATVFRDLGGRQVLNTADLRSPIIEQIESRPGMRGIATPFKIDGDTWLGEIRGVDLQRGPGLQLLVAAPEKELFAKAFAFRNSSVLITLGVIAVTLPIVWLLANQIARPLRRLAEEARAIARFDFERPFASDGHTREVYQLGLSLEAMKTAIGNFVRLITSLSGESDLNQLLDRVTEETMRASRADAALIFLLSDDEQALVAGRPKFAMAVTDADLGIAGAQLPLGETGSALAAYYQQRAVGTFTLERDAGQSRQLRPLFDALGSSALTVIALPLQNRKLEGMGILCLAYAEDNAHRDSAASAEGLGYVRALSGFAAVSMESRQLINMQKALLESFIQLLASAIDAKSPYTGGHCQRVPVLTQMLAAAACASQDPRFGDFDLDDEEWEALRIASWLHDCGKVTTPEYVVDKSTKLETITDRIHEIRMRFEVLKRDAQIERWQRVAQGGDDAAEQLRCDARCRQLDEDFAFVAECNIGGEFMSDDKLERLRQLAGIPWQRTLSDRLGISWEEKLRKERTPEAPLPAIEPLLADRPDHIFYRQDKDRIAPDNPLGFKVDAPEYQYHHGELHNLSVRKGTLTPEERFVINGHMVQTITMLNQLPWPKHLRSVPEIAGGHHETMDGRGYPKRLRREDMSLTARMMAIADIFEALTAHDRPYKKPKTLSETLRIMSFMARDQHIDNDLFDLFLRSGVYLQYARDYLLPQQIDAVDIAQYLPGTAASPAPA